MGLQGVLERLRGEEFTWDEDINFVQDTLGDPSFLNLCEVNDGVAESQSFEQPVGSLEETMKEAKTVPWPLSSLFLFFFFPPTCVLQCLFTPACLCIIVTQMSSFCVCMLQSCVHPLCFFSYITICYSPVYELYEHNHRTPQIFQAI